MKVNSNNTAVELNAYLKQIRQQQKTGETQSQDSSQRAKEADKVNLSTRARDVQQAAQALKAMPDVRAEKVQNVKMDVEKGTYKVDGPRVANGMLHESLENNLILQKVNLRV